MFRVEVQLLPHNLWKWKLNPSTRWIACSNIGPNMEAQDALSDGLDMDQSIANGFTKMSLAIPEAS